MEAYNAGERNFGESRVQELLDKQHDLPDDIHWHFIGHLQTNKVKQIVPFVSLIHSVDSEHLLQKINDEAEKIGRRVDVLLEVHVAKEQTKTGFTEDELRDLFDKLTVYNSTPFLSALNNIRICGLMCMATNTDDQALIRQEFAHVRQLTDELFLNYREKANRYNTQQSPITLDEPILSMGMSEDYLIAIEEGSTMVRIGSDIFGERS